MQHTVTYFLFFFFFFSSCSVFSLREILIQTNKGAIPVYAEVADTEKKREQGLMFREILDKDHGMLFIFDEEQNVSFWMKNTRIPLDMLFIDNNEKIVHIEKNVPPCKNDPCPLYSSPVKVRYVLETNEGFSDTHQISIGDAVLLSH